MNGSISIVRFSGEDRVAGGDYGVYLNGHTLVRRGTWLAIARARKEATEQGAALPSPPWEPCRQGRIPASAR